MVLRRGRKGLLRRQSIQVTWREMKNLLRFSCLLGVLALLLVAGFLTGCASKPKVDWDSRIGNFTYDQAVAELGPPEKSIRTSDAQTVAEWFVKHSPSVSFGFGTGFYSGGSGVSMGQSMGTPPSSLYLRLTFDADGELIRWERIRY